MVSVLVLGFDTATGRPPTSGDSVRTLGALVPAAVEGVVRDVVLLATSANSDLVKVADHAGCGFLTKPDFAHALKAGAAQARSDQVFVLLAGLSFDRALSDEIAGVASRHGNWVEDGVGLHAVESGLIGRILPRLAPTVGLLGTRNRFSTTPAESFDDLLRKERPRRFFKTRAWTGHN